MSKNLCLIDWLIFYYKALGSTFRPCSKSYNQTRLGLKFQTKENPYTKRITKEATKPSSCEKPGHQYGPIGNLHVLFLNHRQTPHHSHRQRLITDHRHERVTNHRLSHQLSLHRQSPSSATPLQTSYYCPILPIHTLPILGTCPKTVSTHAAQFRSMNSLMLQNSLH